MLVKKKTTAQGEWAKKGEDIKDNDAVNVLDSGQIVTGDYGDRHVFKIKTRNGEKLVAFNQTSINNMVDEFGEDTEKWIGATVQVFMIKVMVGGKMQNVVYFAPVGWEMTDDGTFLKSKGKTSPRASSEATDVPDDDVEAMTDATGITLEDIPF